MEPVLIFTDTKRINEEKTVLDKVVTLYQAIYTAIKALNITPTISEIDYLAYVKNNGNANAGYVESYITNKLLDAASPYEMNGITLTREAVRNMLAIPDLSAVKAALADVFSTFTDGVKTARVNLLTLSDDVISKVPDSDDQITAVYAYYTKTDNSAQLVTDLQLVCDAINTFDMAHGGYFSKLITDQKRIYSKNMIPGLKIHNDQVLICIQYIRKYEETGGSLFFAY